MTQRAGLILAVILLLAAIAGNAYLGLNNAGKTCMNISSLAKIEHTLVEGQAAQGRALLKKGLTFGIPKGELDRRVKEGEETQARFLDELDNLSRSSC